MVLKYPEDDDEMPDAAMEDGFAVDDENAISDDTEDDVEFDFFEMDYEPV